MEKFIKFSEKYHLKELALIFFVSLILFGLFYAKQDAYLVDVGREAYVPLQVLQGKVLYKDIFNVYGPLGYQINAFAYLILGTSLNTLYLMGFLNSLLICFTTYFISNLFVDKKISLAVTALTMSACVYIKTFFNFIFAYSYSAVYALSGFLLSLFTMLLYLRDRKTKYLISAFLFAGFSFANKVEYLPYFVILFLSLLFLKPGWKKAVASFGSFMIFPVISFGILLLQGAAFSDFLNGFELIKGLVKTPAAAYFYNAYGLYWNPLYVDISIRYLLKLAMIVFPLALGFYGLNLLNEKYFQNSMPKKLNRVFIFFLMLAASVKFFQRFVPLTEKIFCWMGLFCAVVFIAVIIFNLYKKIKNKIETKDIMFLFLIMSALSVSIKGISGITTECYGTFSLAALFLPFVILFVIYKPSKINNEAWIKTVLNLCFIVVIMFLSSNIKKILETKLYPVKTDRGAIFVRNHLKSQNEFVHYLIQKTPKDAVIVSAPEGAIINFLSNRQSSNYYYYLIPVNVQLFGEERIINDFKKSPPDYFILNNIPYTPFNVGTFCDYAPKVCEYIKSDYSPEAQTPDSIAFTLYRRIK